LEPARLPLLRRVAFSDLLALLWFITGTAALIQRKLSYNGL